MAGNAADVLPSRSTGLRSLSSGFCYAAVQKIISWRILGSLKQIFDTGNRCSGCCWIMAAYQHCSKFEFCINLRSRCCADRAIIVSSSLSSELCGIFRHCESFLYSARRQVSGSSWAETSRGGRLPRLMKRRHCLRGCCRRCKRVQIRSIGVATRKTDVYFCNQSQILFSFIRRRVSIFITISSSFIEIRGLQHREGGIRPGR